MGSLKNVTNLIIKEKFVLILTGIFLFFLTVFWAKFGDPVIDCGREAYIPYSMAFLDKVLFKDIICIYGPVPYYLNALIVRIFGPNLNVFYSIGAILSYAFILTFYLLLKRFIGAFNALMASLFILILCIFSPLILNYIFPYSYSTVYGVLFAILHLFFLIKFIDAKSPKPLYFAAFFISLTMLSKLDFIPCVLILPVLMFLYRKNLDSKAILNVLAAFFAPFISVLAIFLIQKVSINDLIFNFKMIFNMAKAPSLLYFYNNFTGYFFDFKKTFYFLPPFLTAFIVLALLFSLPHFILKIKNKFFKYSFIILLVAVSAFILFCAPPEYIFFYYPLIILLYLVFMTVKYVITGIKSGFLTPSDDSVKFYTILAFSSLVSLKSLFGLFCSLYGIYYLPFIIISLCVFVLKYSKTLSKTGFSAVFASLFLVFFVFNFLAFFGVKTFKIKTSRGDIFAAHHLARPMSEAFEYLYYNLKPEDSLLVLPEGLFLNFVLQKDYKYFNTSFTPLDFDAYGEKYLTESVFNYPPKYILMIPREFKDYGKSSLCVDFGLAFCSKINDNYVLKHYFPKNPIRDEYIFTLLERKK